MPSSKIDALFHRDALCQIARLVDIAATHESHFAREQLQRNTRRDGAKAVTHGRNRDDMVCDLCDVLIAFGCKRDDRGPAGLALLEIRDHFIVRRTFGSHRDHGEPGVDKCNGSMLHLAGRVGFCMQVAHLFELERTFVADGRTHAAAHKQGRSRILAGKRRLMNGQALRIENMLDLRRGIAQLMKEHLYLTGLELAFDLRQQERKQRQAHDLPNKALSRRHGNLLIGLGVNHTVGLARHRTAHHIGDAKDFSALDARIANRRQGICRLARLRHRNHERRGG